MEILTCLQKLYEAKKRSIQGLGCVSRSSLFYYFLKNKKFKPKTKLFYFVDKEGQMMVPRHCVVILNEEVYDANNPSSQNPTSFEKYENIVKKQYSEWDMVWEEWEKSTSGKNYSVDDPWNYLMKYGDSELKEEIKPLLEPEYKELIQKNP